MTARKPYLVAAGLWLVLVVVFFWPVIFQGKVLAPLDIMDSLLRPWASGGKVEVHNAYAYDAISQYLPYDWSVYQSLRQDGYIGWNPYTHSGTAIVENTMVSPGDWHHQLYRFLPFWTAWNTGIIIQFVLAGLGMLLLLRDQKIPAAYALIGVVAFGFYSQFIVWSHHRWLLGAMCWAPWILWSLFRAKKSGRILHLPSIVFIALAFRGGHLQSCVFVVLLVVFIALVDWWQCPSRWNIRQIWRVLLPYAACGILGAVFALDVIVQTVPALLDGNKRMPGSTWSQCLLALPTLITSVFPAGMGTPQGLDLMMAFRGDILCVKFMGGITLLLATVGCCRRQAPLAAKVLFILGLLLSYTPAYQWLYDRVSVIFALGGAWLAAWYLTTISTEAPAKVWKRASIILALIAGVWLIGSAVIALRESWLLEQLHDVVVAKLKESKQHRLDWMLARADVFLKDLLIWSPRNLAMLSLLGLGLFSCSRIHGHSPNSSRFALWVALCTFGEILLFSTTFLTFSDKPQGDGLYSEPAWASRLKHEVGNGTILCLDRSDYDYMQLNTPSAYGIRFADGYETVTPHRIAPYCDGSFEPNRCAASGISHLLVPPGKDPGTVSGWEKVIDSKEFILYKNPAFQSICTGYLADGSKLPLLPKLATANRREILLPANVISVTLMESFNPGWKFTTDGETWHPVHETKLCGMRIELDKPTGGEATRLRLQYHPVYQPYYRPVMGITAIGLLGFSLIRAGRDRRARSFAPSGMI